MNLLSNLKAALIEKGRKRVPFTDLFSLFREVLDDHNRAMELIADMGEKLSGDYLFDITYLKGAYAELRRRLSRVLSSFGELTGNRYAGLLEVYDRIDSSIRSLIFDEGGLSGELVMSYDSITWSMIREVGGKNANLAEIRNNLGLTVPGAFAVTAYSFNEFMRHNGIDRQIADLDTGSPELSRKLSGIRTLIMNGSIPAGLTDAIEQALAGLDVTGGNCFLAVRSSAEGEDSGFSFAGQFETVLHVPCRIDAVQEAYKRVIASLFSDKAVAYQKQVGGDVRSMRMAVGCLRMVEAAVSGVVYTADPSGKKDGLLISATWGLGEALVEGKTDTDMYTVEKNSPFAIKAKRIGRKTSMISGNEEGGTTTVALSAERAESECLTGEEIRNLARQAIAIEDYFRRPVDIEWAIDREGKVFILQARPLRMAEDSPASRHFSSSSSVDARTVAKLDGLVVHQGVGAGRVFVVRDMDDLGSFPRGAVLVSRNDASDFVRVMPYASAIITDTGSLTSHMASLCREFRVPTIVNTGNATSVLEDGKKVTVVIEDDGPVIYEGIVREILDAAGSTAVEMEDLYDFRKKRYVLRYISPLNLLDPLHQKFAPEECRTLHDILRFIHEKAVMELLDRARNGIKMRGAVPLDLPVPAGIMVVDIGGGLLSSNGEKRKRITFDQIASFPFRALLEGMMHPGAWRTDPVPLTAGDFMASMMRMPGLASDSSFIGYNIAVISREYVNLSLRFGYHFAMLDCYCSEHPRDNHLYFRFAGGATDMAKRSRRIQFIADVLKKSGFALRTKGDLIIARLSNVGQDEMHAVLNQTGRLLAFTRQLDAVMHDDSRVERYVNNFLEERYEFEACGIDNKQR